MLRYPERQQVGLTKQMYANIEFRGGAGGLFFKHIFQCMPDSYFMEVLGQLPIPYLGYRGLHEGGTISSIYGLLLVLTLATPLRNLVPTTVHVPT